MTHVIFLPILLKKHTTGHVTAKLEETKQHGGRPFFGG